MLDISLVDKALAGDGKDADEKRISDVETALLSDVPKAADIARVGLESGTTDIRLVTAYFLGVFQEQGPTTLAPILKSLRAAVAERWHSLKPDERKEMTIDGSMAKLFRSMVHHIDVHEAMRDATFKSWSSLDHDTVGGPALRASSALREALEAAILPTLETIRATAPLSELDARIRSFFDRVPAPETPAPATADQDPEDSSATASSSDTDSEDGSPAADENLEVSSNAESNTPIVTAAPARAEGETIAVSPAFSTLLRKIRMVESLLARGQTERAAVVADDVRRTLKDFDPKVFFPDVFLPYFQLLSRHIDEIAPYWEQVESPRWEALSQLYQVNLDVFAGGR